MECQRHPESHGIRVVDLAAKVAADWQRDNSEVVAAIEHQQKRVGQFVTTKKLLTYVRGMFEFWIPLLEKDPPQPERVAREMRDFIKEIRGLLNG